MQITLNSPVSQSPFDSPPPLVRDRLDKIENLRNRGVNPYPQAAFDVTHGVSDIQAHGDALVADAARVAVAGRVIQQRKSSNLLFVDLLDRGQTMQIVAHRRDLPEQETFLWEQVQVGDFVGVNGTVVRTNSGQLSVRSEQVTVLCKPTHPLPLGKRTGDEVRGSMERKDLRYQQRHVDLLTSPVSRERFVKKAGIIRGIRRYLDDAGFIEVHTNIVGDAYGGAAARPFTTHLNALNQEMFLRISPECSLKRLLCGGLDRIYELGPNFRNEGIDSSHNPEFLMLEFYEAYADLSVHLNRFETIVAGVCSDVNGGTRIRYQGEDLDFSTPWRRLSMLDGLREFLGCDVENVSVDEMPRVFDKYHHEGRSGLPDPLTWGNCVLTLWGQCEELIRQPTFITDYPVECSPLTKRHRNDDRLVERFEPHVAGMEIGNAYTEQNDPVVQYDALANQQATRDDQYAMDHEFMTAICHGMPNAAGTGLGVDRVAMLLTDAPSIRDVIAFPFYSNECRLR